MTWVRYGPATDEVRSLLARYDADRQGARTRVAAWAHRRPVGDRYRRQTLPRDYAWTRFHQGLDAHGVTPAFRLLWKDLVHPDGLEPIDIAEAACATLLTPYVDTGPFSRAHFDTLLAPWRAGMDRDPRSRLFIQMAARPPFDRNLWPLVDAALGPAGRMTRNTV